jgi:predicted nucleotidyltransferase
MRAIPLTIPRPEVEAICHKYGIVELSLFGSVLRDDFQADSDVDVLIEFEQGRTLDLDSYIEIRDDLSRAFDGRDIDLVETKRLADPYRRHEILRTREIVSRIITVCVPELAKQLKPLVPTPPVPPNADPA